MTDRELLKLALDRLELAKFMIKMDGTSSHEFLDETIAIIKQRLENKDV